MSALGKAAGVADGYGIYPSDVDKIVGMTFEGANGKRRKLLKRVVGYRWRIVYEDENGNERRCLLATFDRWAKREVE